MDTSRPAERVAGQSRADGVIVAIVAALVAIGIVMVFSATMLLSANRFGTPCHFLWKHLAIVIAGTLAAVGLSNVPQVLPLLKRMTPVLVGFMLALLSLLFVPGVGVTFRGETRWLRLFGFCFQPSELAKFILPIFLAVVLTERRHQILSFYKTFGPTLPVVIAATGLVAMEHDFGTAGLLALICGAVYFAAGVRIRHLAYLGGAALAGAVVAFHKSSVFHTRIAEFYKSLISAYIPHHLMQSSTAIGSGGLWGIGIGKGVHKHLVLAESFNDFIFASLGEEGGFVGAAAVIILFFVLVVRGVQLSLNLSSYFGRLLGFGLVMSLGIQGFMNICVVLGLLPTTGINLPFVSYGGTGLLANLITVGLLLSVVRSSRAEANR